MNFIAHRYQDERTGVVFILHAPQQLTRPQTVRAIEKFAAMKPPRPQDLHEGRTIEYVLTDAPDWFIQDILRSP